MVDRMEAIWAKAVPILIKAPVPQDWAYKPTHINRTTYTGLQGPKYFSEEADFPPLNEVRLSAENPLEYFLKFDIFTAR